MPNWKTYESSVRLLSAIVAAHPELKLNYADIAKYFGDSVTPKAVTHQVAAVKGYGAILKEAYEDGIDPFTAELKLTAHGAAAASKARKTKAKPAQKTADEEDHGISDAFGGDSTKSAMENRFRKIKSHAVLIRKAIASGVDPITLPVGDKCSDASRPRGGDAIADVMGSDVTAGGIRWQFDDRIKPLGRQMLQMKADGLDPKDVDLGAAPKSSKKASKDAISKHFGSDSTGGGIEFQFRSIKNEAKRQRACVASGGDPKGLGIGTGGSNAIAHFFPDATAAALEHFFRPVKKDAKALLAEHGAPPSRGGGHSVSANYGEGTTPKAVATYFERAKKDPNWNLANTMDGNAAAAPGSGAKASGGRKRAAPGTGGKKKTKAAKKELDEDDDENEDDVPDLSGDDFESPSAKKQKTGINKAKAPRVTKARASKPAPGTFVEADDDDEENLRDFLPAKSATAVKQELLAAAAPSGYGSAPSGYGNGSVGYGNTPVGYGAAPAAYGHGYGHAQGNVGVSGYAVGNGHGMHAAPSDWNTGGYSGAYDEEDDDDVEV